MSRWLPVQPLQPRRPSPQRPHLQPPWTHRSQRLTRAIPVPMMRSASRVLKVKNAASAAHATATAVTAANVASVAHATPTATPKPQPPPCWTSTPPRPSPQRHRTRRRAAATSAPTRPPQSLWHRWQPLWPQRQSQRLPNLWLFQRLLSHPLLPPWRHRLRSRHPLRPLQHQRLQRLPRACRASRRSRCPSMNCSKWLPHRACSG